jgi:hypothetical protein
MKEFIVVLILLTTFVVYFAGCRQPSVSNVSSDPKYNFSSFTNTAWKTKVTVALADLEQYNGGHALTLMEPQAFDSTHPEYHPLNMRLIAMLPVGTHLRIGRLMKDNGSWGGVRVTVMLDDGREVNISEQMLAKNQFFHTSPSTNWGISPDMLEATGDGARQN